MSGAGFMLFDMDRVEILRGAQGTLFGRNATGGLVHYITRKPEQEPGGYAKATVGEYSQFRFEGAVGGGISDTVAARLSVGHPPQQRLCHQSPDPGQKAQQRQGLGGSGTVAVSHRAKSSMCCSTSVAPARTFEPGFSNSRARTSSASTLPESPVSPWNTRIPTTTRLPANTMRRVSMTPRRWAPAPP